MKKDKEIMPFEEYVHINTRITEHIQRLYEKGMPAQYLWFNVNHIFGTDLSEKEIEKIIEFNLLTEIYN